MRKNKYGSKCLKLPKSSRNAIKNSHFLFSHFQFLHFPKCDSKATLPRCHNSRFALKSNYRLPTSPSFQFIPMSMLLLLYYKRPRSIPKALSISHSWWMANSSNVCTYIFLPGLNTWWTLSKTHDNIMFHFDQRARLHINNIVRLCIDPFSNSYLETEANGLEYSIFSVF